MLSPTGPLFSGKLRSTTITYWRRTSPYGPDTLARAPVSKYLKYGVYCATVGFDTVAAANPLSDNTMLKLACHGMEAHYLSRCPYLHCRIRGICAVFFQGQALCRP